MNSQISRKRIANRPVKNFVMGVPTVQHELFMTNDGYYLIIEEEIIVRVLRVFQTQPMSMLVEAKGNQIDMIQDRLSGEYAKFTSYPEVSCLMGQPLNQLAVQPVMLSA